MNQQLNKLERMPIGISGTCLAFITLSNAWKVYGIDFLKPIAITLAIGMLLLMFIRLIKFPKVMYAELKNPVTGTFYPTMGMVIWLVSGTLYPYLPTLCSYLWISAAIYHYFIVVFYTIIRVKERQFSNIMPTCFIVYTGMITGSVASKGMDGVIPQIPDIAHFMLMFGFIFYTILLPLVLYIVFRSKKLKDHQLPTIGIICSPAPLGVVGILTIEPNPNFYMLAWLFITGTVLLFVVYGYILKLFKEGFKPGYAAFTFPLAISTFAAYKLQDYSMSIGHEGWAQFFKVLGDMEIFIATYVVLFILLNFIKMFVKALHPGLGKLLKKEEQGIKIKI
ncbi:TDT family transporter [Paenibacillus radicibacter]|uniref:TDT family transporter n=1 Tax=Paenibacillus radicibacter TaxID=2972488 RepID=UPI002158C8BF|nr:TDT family transporter [Paenibacillus radicibacter]